MILFFLRNLRNILWIIRIAETFQLEPGDSFNIIVCLQMCVVWKTGGCTYTEGEVSIRFHIHVCAQVYIIIKVAMPISKERSILNQQSTFCCPIGTKTQIMYPLSASISSALAPVSWSRIEGFGVLMTLFTGLTLLLLSPLHLESDKSHFPGSCKIASW